MLRSSRRWIAVIIAVLLVAGAVFAAATSFQSTTTKPSQDTGVKPLDTSSKKIVAEFEGGKITEGELNAYINLNAFFDPQIAALFTTPVSDPSMAKTLAQQQKQTKEEFAKVYVTKRYIAKQVKVTPDLQKKIDQQSKDLERQVIEYAKSMNPKAKVESLQDAISGKGFNRSQLLMVSEEDAKVDKYLGDRIQNITYERVKLRHILISFTQPGTEPQQGQPKRTEKEAQVRASEVEQKLDAGEDFTKLAKTYSDDPGSKDNGGFYDADPSGFVKEFANAAKTLPIGKISDPIKTEYGFHIMKVEERKQELIRNAPADQQEQLQNAKKQELFEQLQKEVKPKLYI